MNVQNKFKKTNTIYKITKDIDLEGSTLIIPVGCTLDFQGGSFKNGTIEGNGTAIQSELRRIFDDNIVLEGMWNVKEAYPEWFGGKGDGVTDNTQAINNCIKYFTNTYISAGTYITNQIDDIPSFRTINGCGKKSIIQANPKMDLTNSYLLRTKNGGSGITFSNFVLLGGANSTESNYKIGGIYLRSTSNDVNDQWDTRNIIQNVEIKYCYAASIYVGTYQRENKISNCFITHTTNVGINCMGTDNMIIGCTVASSHHEGIVINGNNRVDSCKCFGCGASSTVTGKYALSLIGSKCNVSNVELQQNNYGGCIIQGNSNYVQITCDNNGSGTTNTVLGCHVVGSYNTVSVTSYNFSFHDDQYERYFVSTNWNTVGNNITVNGTPLQKNKMSALSPWSIDNICNNIMWNGYNITQSREVPFDKLVLPDLFRSNGTGSFYVNDSGLSFKLTSVTAVNVDALVQAISIHNSNAIDPDGCFSVKARFHKDGDIDTSVYPIIRVITRYKDSSGTTLTRVDQNTTVNLLDNKDSLDVYALTQYHYLSDKPISILSVSVEFAIRSTKLLSDVSINAYFDDIKIGATTSGNKVKFVNTNIDGTLASKVIIANKLSDFTQENTIYKITTDLNLNTAILELPANCTLDFQGGSISNGTIIGSNTKIKAGLNKIFDTNITLNGSWNVNEVYPEWFGIIGIDANQDTACIQKAIDSCISTNFKSVVLQNRIYQINSVLNITTNCKIEGTSSQVWDRGTSTRLVLAENITGISVQFTGVEIRNIKITGNTTNTGISFTNSSYYFSAYKIVTTGLGIGFDIQHSWTYDFTLCRIEGGTIGFKIQEGTSATFNSCVAFSCTEYGFYVVKLNYGSFNGCGTDGCKYGFYFTDAVRGCTLSSCGSENVKEGGYMVKCGNRAYVTITAYSVGTMQNVNCDLFIFEDGCRVSLIDLNVGSLYHPTGNTLTVSSGASVTLINCYLTGTSTGLEYCNDINTIKSNLRDTSITKINTIEKTTPSIANQGTYTVTQVPLNSVYIATSVATGNTTSRAAAFIIVPNAYESASVDDLITDGYCNFSVDSSGNIIVTNASAAAKAYTISLLRIK